VQVHYGHRFSASGPRSWPAVGQLQLEVVQYRLQNDTAWKPGLERWASPWLAGVNRWLGSP